MKKRIFVNFEFCKISKQWCNAAFPRLTFVLALIIVNAGLVSAQQTGITRIYTDFNGYWTSSSTAMSSIKPDNSHNVLGFTWNGQTYSTGVNDATLTSNGVSFTAMRFQAFPVRNIVLAGTGALPGLGQLKDGVDNGASVPAPFSQPPNISSFLTDGIQGLDIGTGVANVPTGTLVFDFGGIIDPSQIGDGLPDILVSQIADPSAVLDSVYFTDGAGNLVGNKIAINHTASSIPSVGKWVADFYNANGTIAGNFTKTERTIRVWAADISAFGINSSNYSPALTLRYKLNGTSDPAFLAFNANVITVTSANDDISNTLVDAPVNIAVLNNDQPAAALDKSSLSIVTAPAHGNVSVNTTTGVITYIPTAGYSGIDHFTYKVCNNNSATPQCDDAEVTVNVGNADLSVTQLVSNMAPPLSSQVTFTITAANAGANNAFGVRVDDILPAGYTFISSNTVTGSYNNTTGVWTIGNLNNGANAVLTITALVNTSGTYTNTAVISGTLFDPSTVNNTAVITPVPVPASSNLQVTKSVDNATASAGANVVFSITAFNNGPSNAAVVKVIDVLPSGYTYVSAVAPSGTSYNNTTGNWNIGALSTGTNKVLTVTATVKTTGTYLNTATISSSTADPDMANNTATAEVTPSVGTPAFGAGASSSRCEGAGTNTYTASANNTTGIIYSISPIIAGAINSGTGEVTWAATFNGNATVTASAAGVNGPSTATHSVTVTPAAATPVFNAGATSSRCQAAGTSTYTATAQHATAVSYTLLPSGAGSINASTGEVTWNVSFNGSATITASATGCNGTVTASHTVNIITNPVLNITNPVAVCAPATVDITNAAGNGSGISYTYFNDAAGTVAVANPSNISVAGTYYIKGHFANGCSSVPQAVIVTINSQPAINITAPVGKVCKGSAVTLSASSPGNNVSWQYDEGGSTIIVQPLNNTTYTAIATNANGCTNTGTATIETSNFKVLLQANRNPVVAGNTVTLQATANESFDAIAWAPQQFFHSQTGKSQTITVSDTSKTFYVVGRSTQGCIDTASLKVNVNDNATDVFIPNAFTPNGDGRNDVFKAFGSSIMSVEMQIYTQWGNLIFETKDNNTGWNGTHNGKPQPVGVYLYVIKIKLYNNNTLIIKKGNVNLLR